MPGGRYPWAVRAGGPLLGGGLVAKEPDELPNLEFWYDAQDPNTFVLDAGQTVTTWQDKSGNGRDLGQATLANKPVRGLDSGFNSVLFDGIDDVVFNQPLAVTISTTAGTSFIVERVVGNSGEIFRLRTSGFQEVAQSLCRTGQVNVSSTASVGDNALTSFSRDTTVFHFYDRVISNDVDAVIEDDLGNTNTDADVGTIVSPINQIYLGGANTTPLLPSNVHVFEWFGYSDRKTRAELDQLRLYLQTKYGL